MASVLSTKLVSTWIILSGWRSTTGAQSWSRHFFSRSGENLQLVASFPSSCTGKPPIFDAKYGLKKEKHVKSCRFGDFMKRGYSQVIHLSGIVNYKPSILGSSIVGNPIFPRIILLIRLVQSTPRVCLPALPNPQNPADLHGKARIRMSTESISWLNIPSGKLT